MQEKRVMSKAERMRILNEAQMHLNKDLLTRGERRQILTDLNAARTFSRGELRENIAATIKLEKIRAAMPNKVALMLWNPGAVSFAHKIHMILESK
jgi:hypothetical protein